MTIPHADEAWLAALQASGPQQTEALVMLRALLLRGLEYALGDRADRGLLEDAVQEALVKILKHLDTFQGRSRFLTWAQKIAVREALTLMRRRAWKDVSLEDLHPAGVEDAIPNVLFDMGKNPERRATQKDLMTLVMRLIQEELTPKQRRALMAIAVYGMPLEEAARRMNTNRNALYKLLHDARRRLKARLEAMGLSPGEVLGVFQEPHGPR